MRPLRLCLLGLLLASLAFGCTNGGLKRDREIWTYRENKQCYTIGAVGPQWRQISITENDVAFHNRTFHAVLQANATCRQDYEDVSLSILTDHLFYGLTKRKIVKRNLKRLVRRDALFTELSAKLDGVSIQAAMVVLKKNECIYDFSYITRPRNFGRGLGDFWRLVYGFQALDPKKNCAVLDKNNTLGHQKRTVRIRRNKRRR